MKTKYDWSGVDPKVKWIATDLNGFTWGFIPKSPQLNGGYWLSPDYETIIIGKDIYDGYWGDSLEERPNELN